MGDAMPARAARALLLAAVAASPLFVSGAAAAVGQGTFTKVTTPSADLIYPVDPAGIDPFTVAGQTSADVTSVNIDCLSQSAGSVNNFPIAVDVPVSSRTFSFSTDTVPFTLPCRIRAIPTGVDPSTDYLGSYTGPILYSNGIDIVSTVAPPAKVEYSAIASQGTGFALVKDAGTCGVGLMTSIVTASMEDVGQMQTCVPYLPAQNQTSSGIPTASTLTVDGHNAYLPAGVDRFLNGSIGLALPASALTLTFTRHPSGDVTITESAQLVRCSGGDTYPPDHTSCQSLLSTGVRFARVIDMFRGDHQVRFRDNYSSGDVVAHTVTAQYLSEIKFGPASGAPGYVTPGAGSPYAASSPDEVVVGLGTKAATVFERSDFHSAEGDPAAATIGITWSRAPSKMQFAHSTFGNFAMPYSLKVPAGGRAFVGFAVSQGVTTAEARALARTATNEMVLAPSITSPKTGAVVHGHLTTVRGSVSLGANGIPT